MEIRTGRVRYVPKQRFLGTEEVYAEIADYERRHPRLVRIIPRWLDYPLDGAQGARRRFADSVCMVAFRPKTELRNPGGTPDGVGVRYDGDAQLRGPGRRRRDGALFAISAYVLSLVGGATKRGGPAA